MQFREQIGTSPGWKDIILLNGRLRLTAKNFCRIIILCIYIYIYFSILDSQKRTWRFDRKNKECALPQLILQTEFHDTNYGYLRRGKCMFGVEIDMCSLGKGEIIPPIKNVTSSYMWKLNNFSASYAWKFCYYSQFFTIADIKWYGGF